MNNNKKLPITLVDLNLMIEALQYTAEQIETSAGDIAPFLKDGYFYDEADRADAMLYLARLSKDLAAKLIDWEGYGHDMYLAIEDSDK